MRIISAVIVYAMLTWSCGASGDPKMRQIRADSISVSNRLIHVTNKNGLRAVFTPEGARLVSLSVPGRNGRPVGVVIGFDTVAQYRLATEPYFGATIGRYGNRIANGRFTLDGKQYELTVNNGPNTLHGGSNGFQYKTWQAEQTDSSFVIFRYVSEDGEEGFPGNLNVTVWYALTDSNELRIRYEAKTDKPTVVNLTNHAFFNLNGEGSGSIKNHLMQINADHFLPVDSTLIPTGVVAPVKGTPFEFREPRPIGELIAADDEQLKFGNGYDHNFVLNGTGMKKAAAVRGDRTGIYMEVFTDQPGLQFYSGNFMQGANKMRAGMDEFRTAFCLETQHFPDSPNQPSFPPTVLRPGQTYRSVSLYKFSLRE